MSDPRTVEVHVDLERLSGPQLMGILHNQQSGRGELFSFEYAREWLQHSEAFAFDPDLSLAQGRQYPSADRVNFGIFTDSSPDRWGRLLLQRRENLNARKEKRRPRTLREWDFLLGVHDETRLGALRFRFEGGAFLDKDTHMAAPPLTSLRALEAASLAFEQHLADEENPAYERWLTQLMPPGSSLGGARPKASVRDESGDLCIAKFPSRQDTRDVGAWELVANRLAHKAGIQVSAARPLRFQDSSNTTFLVRRFDRTARGGRLAFVSAMTLTQHRDGDGTASYLELIDLLRSRGSNTSADCEQLFRRVLFNILIHNTDDHLRNHGFFIEQQGLRLSPAFDLNPSVESRYLTLAIDEVETACDADIAMQAHESYGLKREAAERALADVTAAIAQWRTEARKLNIPKAEQELMAAAFEA